MAILIFNDNDLRINFIDAVLQLGQTCEQHGLLRQIEISNNGTLITGLVAEPGSKWYQVHIFLIPDSAGFIDIEGYCDCEKQRNCEHVVALLYHVRKLKQKNNLADHQPSGNSWLHEMDHVFSTETYDQSHAILYVLTAVMQHEKWCLHIALKKARLIKKNTYTRVTPIIYISQLQNCLLTEEDRYLFHQLRGLSSMQLSFGEDSILVDEAITALLPRIIESGRAYWVSSEGQPLHMGRNRKANFFWQTTLQGEQEITCRVVGSNALVIPFDPPWYIDLAQHECGLIESDFSAEKMRRLFAIRNISATVEPKIIKQQQLQPDASIKKITTTPVPYLYLCGVANMASSETEQQAQVIPAAQLYFIYDTVKVSWQDTAAAIHYFNGSQLIECARDFSAEQQFIKQLDLPIVSPPRLDGQTYFFIINAAEPSSKDYALDFLLKKLPILRETNWQIEIDASFPVRFLEQSDDWYSAIEDMPHHNWFSFELGITVGGEKINIVPALLKWLQQHPGMLDKSLSEQIYLPVAEDRYLSLPTIRVNRLLTILRELYADTTLQSGKLYLSYLHAPDVMALEEILGPGNLRWYGGAYLKQLAQKIKQIGEMKPVVLPKTFGTELRTYQQQGLNWLQGLRELNLAGILADDMGLGKTVQTLAHLLVEKDQGRMIAPSLIVGPTSLVVNWWMEAKRFAPTLKILMLYGSDRKQHYTEFDRYDVILTTYPLLLRDAPVLLQQKFYFLILDEAQVIKNARAKSTKILSHIQAEHRLCLTGTPLENHLGDLWSLYNFLLPGLLGTQQQFNRLYRHPVEKLQNTDRKNHLAKRIAPFLLRRTKDAVTPELPAKTEIIRSMELQDEQRDLYEMIRMSMQTKVAEIIELQGVARSKIIILDALLKLRQTCCDPRLLKLPSAKNITRSVKMDLLMEMLPRLIEEGRKILLFSSFATMLEIISERLIESKIDFVKLTGKTKDRQTLIDRFQRGEVPLFLISLKAGGVGLNLTAADTVIHYDPWWNPAAEDQATDRAHRIGQNKPVFVYKLVTVGTVEEKILLLQQHKRGLLNALFRENVSDTIPNLLEDLNYLLSAEE